LTGGGDVGLEHLVEVVLSLLLLAYLGVALLRPERF
jgi:K+-transporting ATPase KdpF subunit